MSRRLEDLLPEVADKVQELLAAAKIELASYPDRDRDLMVIHTLREDEEQALIHAKGRTRPGEPCVHQGVKRPVGTCKDHKLGVPVTNAKPGSSWHNFGRAVDLAFVVNGKPSWNDKHPWHVLGMIAAKVGLEWGVMMKNGERGDLGHLQDRGGMTLAQARSERDRDLLA